MLANVRHAATLIVLDSSDCIRRVLMGKRSATARFMPSFDVFPGGALDEADFTAQVGSALPALTMAHLSRAADPALATALAVAAARELVEETGLSLGVPPRLDGLRYLCRAVTPPASPIRFDARFFVVDRDRLDAEDASVPLLEDGELAGLAWRSVDDLEALRLALPTRMALTLLADRLSGRSPWPDVAHAPLPLLINGRDWSEE